jgi:hypothetical protein
MAVAVCERQAVDSDAEGAHMSSEVGRLQYATPSCYAGVLQEAGG